MRRYRVGPFELRGARLVVAHNSKQVAAGPKVVDTLAALIDHRPDVATKEALRRRIWPGCSAAQAKLMQNVYVLRRLFREHGADDAIETLPGIGYRLKLSAQPLGGQQLPPHAHPLRLWPSAVAVTAVLLCMGPLVAA